jgi:hypothetical protein
MNSTPGDHGRDEDNQLLHRVLLHPEQSFPELMATGLWGLDLVLTPFKPNQGSKKQVLQQSDKDHKR